MTKEELDKLNRRLLKFAGFKQKDYIVPSEIGGTDLMSQGWLSPEGEKLHGRPPNFPASLDACFKHLVPEYRKLLSYESLFGRWLYFLRKGHTPSLALCLAIERLIKEEGK